MNTRRKILIFMSGEEFAEEKDKENFIPFLHVTIWEHYSYNNMAWNNNNYILQYGINGVICLYKIREL